MEIFKLDNSAVEQLRLQGYDLREKIGQILSPYFFPECKNFPSLTWLEMVHGYNLLMLKEQGRKLNVSV